MTNQTRHIQEKSQRLLKDKLQASIEKVLPDVVEFRRSLHRNPELTWQESDTSAFVREHLAGIPGLELRGPIAKHGIVGVVGSGDGPTIALRADMDGLPINEDTGLEYASCRPGKMHACGHDGHMANLWGAVKVICEHRAELPGKVVFVFQPAEEGGAGALAMCEEGLLDDPKVDYIYGLHAWPQAELGTIQIKSGPLLASNTVVSIVIKGSGGHAAFPHLTQDTILAASRVVEQLQSVRSRLVEPAEPMVLSICQFNGGTATNVIPDKVTLKGSLRTVSDKTLKLSKQAIEQIAAGVCHSMGLEAVVDFEQGYPVTLNHDDATECLKRVASRAIGGDRIEMVERPHMGAEDFSFYLQRVPGSFFLLGQKDRESSVDYPSLHSSHFDFNDQSLVTGMKVFSHLAFFHSEV